MKRVMVVDDEAVITTQLEERLKSMEYDVVGTASSAEESVSLARELCPDLVLMDIVMKGELDGIDAARTIKEDMDIPVIFLTAYADDKFINRAMQVEPFGYIVKPYRESEIKANIEIALYRKELERDQKQAEQRIRKLFLAIEHNPYMIMIMDAEGQVEYANSSFVQLTRYSMNEVVGKNASFLKSDDISPELYSGLCSKITSGEEFRGTLSIRKKDGTPDLKYTVILPVKNDKDEIIFFLVVMEEISRHEKRREALLQPEKMNSLRTLVSGIAHEFNNILAVIQGRVELLEDGYDDVNELKEGLHNIVLASEVGAGIVKNMISIAKSDKDTSEYVLFELRQLIVQAIDSTIPGWKDTSSPGKKKYEIDRNDMKRIPGVFCNPTEMREVFVIIINNALDAMPEGGSISFSTWNDEDKVFVKISDKGMGMSEEVKRRVFDPFFTTRRPQRTGLGMGVAYSIITRHGGNIEIESEVGKGTIVTMSLPIKSNNY